MINVWIFSYSKLQQFSLQTVSFATNVDSINRDRLLSFELQSYSVMRNSLDGVKISHPSIIPGPTFTSNVFRVTLMSGNCTGDFKHIRTISVSFLLYWIVELFDNVAINGLFTIVGFVHCSLTCDQAQFYHRSHVFLCRRSLSLCLRPEFGRNLIGWFKNRKSVRCALALALACVAGGISRASAFALVAKPWTRLAKPWEDWLRDGIIWRLRRRSPAHASRQLRRLDVRLRGSRERAAITVKWVISSWF